MKKAKRANQGFVVNMNTGEILVSCADCIYNLGDYCEFYSTKKLKKIKKGYHNCQEHRWWN